MNERADVTNPFTAVSFDRLPSWWEHDPAADLKTWATTGAVTLLRDAGQDATDDAVERLASLLAMLPPKDPSPSSDFWVFWPEPQGGPAGVLQVAWTSPGQVHSMDAALAGVTHPQAEQPLDLTQVDTGVGPAQRLRQHYRQAEHDVDDTTWVWWFEQSATAAIAFTSFRDRAEADRWLPHFDTFVARLHPVTEPA